MDFHFSAIFAPWDKCKFASRFIIAAVNENHAVSDSFFEKFSVISVFCASLVPELACKYGAGTKVKSIIIRRNFTIMSSPKATQKIKSLKIRPVILLQP